MTAARQQQEAIKTHDTRHSKATTAAQATMLKLQHTKREGCLAHCQCYRGGKDVQGNNEGSQQREATAVKA